MQKQHSGRVTQANLAVGLALGVVVVVGLILASVRESQAIPAWARKYNADCSMCHYPVIPRLNSFGHQFRRAGYRLAEEFGKEQDVTRVGDFLSVRLRPRFSYQDMQGQIKKSQFTLNDATFFYAGAISKNFSGFVESEIESDGDIELIGQLQGVFGKSDRYLSFRMGQMHTLPRVGFSGFDRPSGISTNPLLSTTLTRAGPINGANFALNTDEKGLEIAYVQGRGRLLAQVLDGVNQDGSGTASPGDVDADKDFLVAYEHILDDIASGVTAFYYKGSYPGIASPSAVSELFNFYRLGIMANKVFPVGFGYFELQGGYIRSSDNVPAQVGPNVRGHAGYVESQQYLTGPEITFLERFSIIDMETVSNNVRREDFTIGVVAPVQTWLRVAAEYTYTTFNGANGTGLSTVLELQANW
ncbi:MAG TPA: hypothetical protein VFL31_07430 [Nitrospiraceae bacterium]|nr:hypothetical protein [Nitrospiraceae bacterium]